MVEEVERQREFCEKKINLLEQLLDSQKMSDSKNECQTDVNIEGKSSKEEYN